MVGFRSKDYYLKKFGGIDGLVEYEKLLETRSKRQLRKEAGRQTSLTDDPEKDLIDGRAIRCKACGKITSRLQWTHFKNKCVIKSIAEYKEKFPDALLVAPLLCKNTAVTRDGMIELYGSEEGVLRWDQYRSKQAKSNSLEYKRAKYGMTEEQFLEFNISRSVTLANMISRHGEDNGLIKWTEYCDRQRYTTSLEYFIEKYGEFEGIKKYDGFIDGRNLKGKSLSEVIAFEYLKNNAFGDDLEFQAKIPDISGSFDMKYKNVLIEYHGRYWHADPRFYAPDFINSHSKKSSNLIWKKDALKEKKAITCGYRYYVIWEDDFNRNMDITLKRLLEWIDGTDQAGTSSDDSENRTTR